MYLTFIKVIAKCNVIYFLMKKSSLELRRLLVAVVIVVPLLWSL
jgi:hypothetical protein